MKNKKLLVFIVTYDAEKTIETVLSRLPEEIFQQNHYTVDVLIIDDCSKDKTFEVSHNYKRSFRNLSLVILKNPKNLGYGGNQKLGYHYALENGYDIVALLHGDGQYAPEELPKLLAPLIEEKYDAVFGSRMMIPFAALKGGMPVYKYFGNKFLTWIQNYLVGTSLSEYHSGYRIYSTTALKSVPFRLNSNGFDFDTDIIIQFHTAKLKILEMPIPTFYGDEICHVNGVPYALKIISTCLRYRLQQFGIFYERKFDIREDAVPYRSKFHFYSSHSLALDSVETDDSILLLGCGPFETVEPFYDKTSKITLIDANIDQNIRTRYNNWHEADLDSPDVYKLVDDTHFDKILMLDVIEHLKSPEQFLENLHTSSLSNGATVIITTPNIAFLPIRLMLLFGQFNYGNRGILDRTHTRLFTFSSIYTLLEQYGFRNISVKGIPAPFPLAVGDTIIGRLFLSINKFFIAIARSWFSYQIYIEAVSTPTVEQLLRDAEQEAVRSSPRF